jgi:peptidoglycan/LPS O-acetylase OafA/YrhL
MNLGKCGMSTISKLDSAGASPAVDPAKEPMTAQAVGLDRAHSPHLPSLDGLRFIAALNVVVAHGYWYVVLLQQEPTPGAFENLMRSGANLGMTLFFVLSGFVIHYNYHKTVPQSMSGKLDFFIARFARLYPLFLLVFAYDFVTLLWAQGYFSGYVFSLYDPFKALPQYLTFTEAWWWWPIGQTYANEYYGTWLTGATGVMWSLSTEVFFYFAYLFCAGALTRLSGRRLAIFGIAVTAYGLIYYAGSLTHTSELKQWALLHYPDSNPDQFTHWILFQSPLGRISEFLLGVVAAQAFLSRPKNLESESIARLLTYGALGAFILFFVWAYGNSGTPVAAIGTQCGAPFIAILIYGTARYRSALAQALSSSVCVKLGNASYSLYLLHYFVVHQLGQRLVEDFPQVSRWLIFFCMVVLALIVSYASYILIERPAIRWVRANFRPLRLTIWLPATLMLVSLFSVLVSVHMSALANSDPAEPAGYIHISSASFGENCNAALHDNVLGLMRRACNGTRSCNFDYDIEKLRDPAGGCEKQFQVLYSCGPNDKSREYLISKFNRPQMNVAFSCSK